MHLRAGVGEPDHLTANVDRVGPAGSATERAQIGHFTTIDDLIAVVVDVKKRKVIVAVAGGAHDMSRIIHAKCGAEGPTQLAGQLNECYAVK